MPNGSHWPEIEVLPGSCFLLEGLGKNLLSCLFRSIELPAFFDLWPLSSTSKSPMWQLSDHLGPSLSVSDPSASWFYFQSLLIPLGPLGWCRTMYLFKVSQLATLNSFLYKVVNHKFQVKDTDTCEEPWLSLCIWSVDWLLVHHPLVSWGLVG